LQLLLQATRRFVIMSVIIEAGKFHCPKLGKNSGRVKSK
jgi:hypothetical protein